MKIKLKGLTLGDNPTMDKRSIKKYDPAELKKLRDEGMKVTGLARHFGRSPNTIRVWLDTEGLPRKLAVKPADTTSTVMERSSEIISQRFLAMPLLS